MPSWLSTGFAACSTFQSDAKMHRTPKALRTKTKPTSNFRTLPSESIPADLPAFVLFFQPAHERLEVIHHRAGRDVLTGGLL
jgi:hypothetical protein